MAPRRRPQRPRCPSCFCFVVVNQPCRSRACEARRAREAADQAAAEAPPPPAPAVVDPPPPPVAPPPYPPPDYIPPPPPAPPPQHDAPPPPPPPPVAPPPTPPPVYGPPPPAVLPPVAPPPEPVAQPPPVVPVGPADRADVASEISSVDSVSDSDSGISQVSNNLEDSCSCCLTLIRTFPVSRNNTRVRAYSQLRRVDGRAQIPLCLTCFKYVCINDNLGEPQDAAGNQQNPPNPRDADSDSENDDASDNAPSDNDEEQDQPHPPRGGRNPAGNKFVKWQYGWRAFLTDFILKSNTPNELRKRLAYIPRSYSDLWGQTFLQRLRERNRVSIAQFRNASRDIQRKVLDISTDIQRFNDSVGSGQLSQLAAELDRTAVATVRCPYGCTEYIENVGSIAYNHFLRWGFPSITAFTANSELHLKGARADFTERTEQFGYTVTASVRTTSDHGLVLCTCNDHDKGSAKVYIHAPQNPHGTLPSLYSDQLTPVIFAPKPFRGMKAKYSSHTWQMRCVQGGFSGLSSFSVTTKPKWNIRSDHHADLEKTFLEGRPELRAFVDSAYRDDLNAAPAIESLERVLVPSQERQDTALAGATYVTLPESIDLLHSMKHKVSVQLLDDQDEEEQQEAQQQQPQQQQPQQQLPQQALPQQALPHPQQQQPQPHVAPAEDEEQNDAVDEAPEHPRRRNITWPLAYARAQRLDEYGDPPQLVNTFPQKFLPLLWIFVRLITFVTALWRNFAQTQPLVEDDNEELTTLQSCKAFLSSFLPGGATSRRARYAPAHRGSPTDAQHHIRQRAQTVVGLIPDPNLDAQCLDTSVILSRFLKTLPNTHACFVNSRSIQIDNQFISQQLQELPDDEARHKCSIISICTTAPRTTIARARRPDSQIILEDSSWELVAFIRADGNAGRPWDDPQDQNADRRWGAECYLRNIGDHPLWFKSTRSTTIEYLPAPAEESLRDAYVSWQSLIYVRTSGGYLAQSKMQYLQFTGGQGTMVCHDHELPFIVTPPMPEGQPRLTCCFRENDQFTCNRLAKWSCPSDNCTASLCRLHSKQVLDNIAQGPPLVRIHPRVQLGIPQDNVAQPQLPEDNDANDDPLARLIEDQHAEEGSEGSAAEDGHPDFLLDGAFELDEPIAPENLPDDQDNIELPGTNAADVPVMVDDSTGVPGHILLNKHYGLLNRPGVTNYISARSGAFFQRLTSRFAGASIPLLYPEGMLFPSIFWKSLADGTVIGALPHCLWTAPGACKKAGFATLSEHVKTRLTDPTLLTSTDPRAIQFYFDALFNLQLSHSDTRTLRAEGRLPFGEADSRTRVNELAAEIAHKALHILEGCGLAEVGRGPCGYDELLPTAELIPKKHMYPADPHTRFSPMNDWIFAAAKSSDNLQICEEERARVFLRAGKDANTVNVQEEKLRNTKVSNRIAEESLSTNGSVLDLVPKPKKLQATPLGNFYTSLPLGSIPIHSA
ncbi:hypothetical protein FOZ63_013245 [Perkinsus olseni]|uniref:Uncharacterized protein n=1 Tax=Perkinsus olseni TaxID=32597 RepID=A0A7J6QE64_PEROL|nr:hypothetical protein FOZ63_013245 [Perkinsus olseni]